MKLPPPKERELTALEITLQAAQPAGFYKDTENEDLDKRSDSRQPYKLHPLSYVELSIIFFTLNLSAFNLIKPSASE